MVDPFSRERRAEIMGRIKGRDTRPEMVVRRILYGLGYRYRLHRKNLPGKPDITLAKLRTIIFVHGCFWHSHPGCRRATIPATRQEWWREKLEKNAARDRANQLRLSELGWRIVVVWECETKRPRDLTDRLVSELTR